MKLEFKFQLYNEKCRHNSNKNSPADNEMKKVATNNFILQNVNTLMSYQSVITSSLPYSFFKADNGQINLIVNGRHCQTFPTQDVLIRHTCIY